MPTAPAKPWFASVATRMPTTIGTGRRNLAASRNARSWVLSPISAIATMLVDTRKASKTVLGASSRITNDATPELTQWGRRVKGLAKLMSRMRHGKAKCVDAFPGAGGYSPMTAGDYTGRIGWADAVIAGGSAALLSGLPSTLYALMTGADAMEATRAAGAMLISAGSSDSALFAAAAVVHLSVSAFWTAVLVPVLPQRHTTFWAVVALAAVAVLDLQLIGRLFPEILALPFGPQFVDHLAFGAVLGGVLEYRRRQRSPAP